MVNSVKGIGVGITGMGVGWGYNKLIKLQPDKPIEKIMAMVSKLKDFLYLFINSPFSKLHIIREINHLNHHLPNASAHRNHTVSGEYPHSQLLVSPHSSAHRYVCSR